MAVFFMNYHIITQNKYFSHQNGLFFVLYHKTHLMNKRLLLSTCLAASAYLHAQTIENENFETFNLGNLADAIGISSPGQGGFIAYGVPSSVNFQVIDGANNSKSIQMIGQAIGATTEYGFYRELIKNQWPNRSTGNDIVELEFDLYTAGLSTSGNRFGAKIEALDPNNVKNFVAGIRYTNSSKVLKGFYTAASGTYTALTPNTGDFTLSTKTWVRCAISYNSITGSIKVKYADKESSIVTPFKNTTPQRAVFLLDINGTTNNAPELKVQIDNIITRFVATESLLHTREIYKENLDTAVYLNQNQLEVSAKVAVKTLEVYNLAGQLVASANGNSVDVAALGKGTYVAKYSDNKNTYSKRFVK
jgi:hypothetical protein